MTSSVAGLFNRKGAWLFPNWGVVFLLTYSLTRQSDAYIGEDGIVRLEYQEMLFLLREANETCSKEILSGNYPSDGRRYCNLMWDGIMCWNNTLAGTVARQNCASYVNKFNATAFATRECSADGTWRVYPDKTNNSWTDYSQCTSGQQGTEPGENYLTEHLPRIKLMYHVGFSLSIVCLVLAIFIMIYFKKLHCARNTIHINLFLSFIVRAVCLILKDSLFVNGMGFSYDLYDDTKGAKSFTPNETHWQCKLFITFTWYSMCTNLMWIFVEALYLYLLIFVAVFSERNNILRYIIFGWTAPLSFIIPWVLVRLHYEDDYCWQINEHKGFVWIIQGPIVLVVLANFFIFLATVWTLFTKLQASNTPEARRYRYRKLARSTLVLIPLFGVYYIFLVWMPVGTEFMNRHLQLIYFYTHSFLDSFQGIAVTFLFCFLNGEVRTELRKKCAWQGRDFPPGGGRSTWTTVSTYVSRARHSLHSSHSTMDKSDMGHSNGNAFSGKQKNYTPPRTPPRDQLHNNKAIIETKLVNLERPEEEEQRLIKNGNEQSAV